MPKIKLLDNLNHNGTEFDRDAVIDTDEIDITESQLACLLSVGAVQVLEVPPVVDAGAPKKPAKGKAAKQAEEDNGMNALIEGAPVGDTAPSDEAE